MSAHPIASTPLNRIVDAVPPESDLGRRFDEAVNTFIEGRCRDASVAARLRAQLTKWRDNDGALQYLAMKSSFVKEVAPLSQDLYAAANAGLGALDASAKGTPLADDAKAQLAATLAAASKAKAQLLLMPAPSIRKLIDAAASGGACAEKL